MSNTAFEDWLTQQIGPCKWIVARSNKKLRAQGFDRFFNRRTFRALERAFTEESEPVDNSPTTRLTEPDPDLAAKRRATPPGMAHWAGTGPAGKTCRECSRWKEDGYVASSSLLRAAPCGKYESMMNGVAGPRVPHYTPSCKYFEQNPSAPALSKPKQSMAAKV